MLLDSGGSSVAEERSELLRQTWSGVWETLQSPDEMVVDQY